MRPSTQLLLVVAFLASVAQNQASVCLDNYGNEVDWWVAIKFPNSLSYSYYLSSGSSFVQSEYDVGTAGGGPIYHTLNQIYDGDADTYVMYNDASPDGVEHYSFGHTKGVAAARDDDAFFLVQSIPKFPPPKDQGYGVESNAHYFGQSFFCMTMTKEGLEATAGQWLYTHPYIYDSYVADPTGYSNLMNVISGNFVSAATTSVQSLKTKYGVPLSYMVKTAAWDKDLYASLVAPTLESSILVETWMDSDDPLLSQCAPNVTYSVKNVQSLSFTNTFFYEADDHSKWAISSDDILGEVCIGGINRDKSQFQRAGGTMCFQPENGLHQAMYDAIQSVAGCGYARTEENTNHIPAFTLEDSKNDRSGHPGRSEHGTAIVLGVVFGIAGVCALAIAVAFVVVRRNRNGRGLPKDTPLQQRFLSDEEAQEAKV